MKDFNLRRLMDASPFTAGMNDELFDAIMNYYIQFDVDLNTINIDNDMVNGLKRFITKKECKDYTIVWHDKQNKKYYCF